MSPRYLIWSTQYTAWWAPLGLYTPDVHKAERYGRDFALQVCKAANPIAGVPSHIIILEADALECFGKKDADLARLEQNGFTVDPARES